MSRWLALPLVALTSASIAAQESPFEDRLTAARAEARQATEAAEALASDAANARNEAERLQLQTQALAEEIAAAEAQLNEATIELEALRASRAEIEARLAEERLPLAHLTAGLATLSRRPPLASLADAQSTRELVRLQVLIDASLPAIANRTAALENDLARLRSLDQATEAARGELANRRSDLDAKRTRFAQAEARQQAMVGALEAAAFRAESRRIAVSEELADLDDDAARRAKAAAEARALATYPASDVAARRGATIASPAPFGYVLPSEARVIAGLGSISADGIRARGITLDTRRGERVRAPASGHIGFAGPLRQRDAVIVIDHGDGWVSLLTGVTTSYSVGDRVGLGDDLGRARGPIGVELWHEGHPRSPALIAGSSAAL